MAIGLAVVVIVDAIVTAGLATKAATAAETCWVHQAGEVVAVGESVGVIIDAIGAVLGSAIALAICSGLAFLNVLAIDEVVAIIVDAVAAVLARNATTRWVTNASCIIAVDQVVAIVIDAVVANFAVAAVAASSTEWIVAVNEAIKVIVFVVVANFECAARLRRAIFVGAVELAIVVIVDAVVADFCRAAIAATTTSARTVLAVIYTGREKERNGEENRCCAKHGARFPI